MVEKVYDTNIHKNITNLKDKNQTKTSLFEKSYNINKHNKTDKKDANYQCQK